MTRESERFPNFRFAGDNRSVGRQHGEACRALIKRHLEYALRRLESNASATKDAALATALSYRPHVLEHAPYLDDEIQGLAEGAGLELAEAYLLQLRAEVTETFMPRGSHLVRGESLQECTTFAASGAATLRGEPLLGQNADLPAFYTELGIIVELELDNHPNVLMLTPAGQISYIGINSFGLGVCANYLTCDGWRAGFPRYLWSRVALRTRNVREAVSALRKLHRASSRNIMLADSGGTIVDLETTPTRIVEIHPVNETLAHANHYLSDELREEERSPEAELQNSRARQKRMEQLLRDTYGCIDASQMQDLLRDRSGCPDALCRKLGDDESDIVTFASLIAEPSRGRIHVAKGPPHEHEYVAFSFKQPDVDVGASRSVTARSEGDSL